jgi:hypothetical protein
MPSDSDSVQGQSSESAKRGISCTSAANHEQTITAVCGQAGTQDKNSKYDECDIIPEQLVPYWYGTNMPRTPAANHEQTIISVCGRAVTKDKNSKYDESDISPEQRVPYWY